MDFMLVHANFLILAVKLAVIGLIVGFLLDRLESTLKDTPYEAVLLTLFAAFMLITCGLVYLELPH